MPIAAFLLLAATLTSLSAQQPPSPRVILISVDGMTPVEYTDPDAHHLKVPNLRELRAQGCASPGVHGVFPASTYPNHTSIITGQPPAIHGVTTNVPTDPFNLENGGWFYYAEKIKVPTLFQVLRDAGLKTAAVSWPVTVGAPVDFLLPEYRPIRTPEDLALMHQLATPGLFRESELADTHPDRPMSDPWRIAATEHILLTRKPAFLALHLSDLDEVQHRFGPHTPETHAQLEIIDAQIGELRRFVQASLPGPTTWIVVSDHGFMPIAKQFNPMVALHDAGLITTDPGGKVTGWKVFANNLTGSAFLIAHDRADRASIQKATALMNTLAQNPANGIAKVDTPADLVRMGAAPEAFLALEASPGFGFGTGISGSPYGIPPSKGAHGFNPDLPEMHSSLILAGAGVPTCTSLPNVTVFDIAPTAAALLGVPMPNTQGHNLIP